MCDLARRTALDPNTPHVSAVKRMPAIVDDGIPPDMGRMTARLYDTGKSGDTRTVAIDPERTSTLDQPGPAAPLPQAQRSRQPDATIGTAEQLTPSGPF